MGTKKAVTEMANALIELERAKLRCKQAIDETYQDYVEACKEKEIASKSKSFLKKIAKELVKGELEAAYIEALAFAQAIEEVKEAE